MSISREVQQQEERPSHQELVGRARALEPLLRENAAEGELLRRLPDTVSDALIAAGMFRLLTPTRFGGYAADLRTVINVSETLWATRSMASHYWGSRSGSARLSEQYEDEAE
jgi:3-hydroxy-9,10-secoandrosta-1,3,5(10)-triene-9,17-dione monooxygenase